MQVGLDHDVIFANDDLDDLPVALVLVERREDFEKHIEVERAIAETNPPTDFREVPISMYLRYHDLEQMEAWEISYNLEECPAFNVSSSLSDLGLSRRNLADTGIRANTFGRKMGERDGLLRKSSRSIEDPLRDSSVGHKLINRRSSVELAMARSQTDSPTTNVSRHSTASSGRVSEAESRRVCVLNWKK